MKNISLVILIIATLLSAIITAEEKVKPITQLKKKVSQYTTTETLYYGSILFGYQTATKHRTNKFFKINLDKVIEGFKAKAADQKTAIDSKELIQIRANFRKASNAGTPPNQIDIDKISFFQGIQDASNFISGPLPVNQEAFILGVLSVKNKQPLGIDKTTEELIFKKIAAYAKNEMALSNEKAKKEGNLFLEANAKKQGVISLPSKLQYKIIKKGTANKVQFTKGCLVKVNFSSRLLNGKEVENTYKKEEPFYIHYNDSVMPGLREALSLMNTGSSWEVYIPSSLAYNGAATNDLTINSFSTFIYQVDVLDIIKTADQMFLELNQKKENVVTLPNGVQYKIIKSGTGNLFTKGQKAKVHYEGRTIGQQVFDSSYKRGKPIEVDFDSKVIAGWKTVLPLMKQGDIWEIYIPGELAYGQRGSPPAIKPHATLIFKMEIVKFSKEK